MKPTPSKLICTLKDHNNSSYERRRAARSLAQFATPDSIEALSDALDDGDSRITQAAILSLLKLNAKKVLLQKILRPKLIASTSQAVRWSIAHALAHIGELSHFEQLYRLLNDSDWVVRNETVNTCHTLINNLDLENIKDNLKTLIRMLKIDHDELRDQIIKRLCQLDTNSWGGLFEGLESDDINIKTGIIRVLGESRNHLNVKQLIELADHQNESVKKEAIVALGKIGGCLAINKIIEKLGDGNPNVVNCAKKSIIALKDDEVVSKILLNNLSNISNIAIKQNIISIIGKTKRPEMIRPIMDNLGNQVFRIRNTATKAALEYGEGVRRYLAEKLFLNEVPIEPIIDEAVNSKVVRLRIRALRILGQLGDTSSLEITAKLVQSDIPPIAREAEKTYRKISSSIWSRSNAIYILGELGGEESVDLIIDHLNEKNPMIRLSAITALRKIRTVKSFPSVIKVLQTDTDKDIRAYAASVVGEIASFDKETINILIKCSNDLSKKVRAEIARVLCKIDDEIVIDPLLKLLEDDSFVVRRNVLNALYTIGNKIIPQLLAQMEQSKNKQLKLSALNLLGAFYAKEHIDEERRYEIKKILIKEKDKEFRIKAKGIIRTLNRNIIDDRNLALLEF